MGFGVPMWDRKAPHMGYKGSPYGIWGPHMGFRVPVWDLGSPNGIWGPHVGILSIWFLGSPWDIRWFLYGIWDPHMGFRVPYGIWGPHGM